MSDKKELSEELTDANPFVQFNKWYTEHFKTGIEIPDSVTLGTASRNRKVSLRTVLLKSFDEAGFVFFTNYNSRKANQLSANPMAALLFYWPESARQVRIEGKTEKVSEEESEKYFKSRPRESQLSAWTSEQSTVIPNRQYLENRYDFYQNKFKEKPVEKPPYWGGYRLIPEWFEFWQEGMFRLHDRISYTRKNDLWVIERLAP